MNLKTMEISFKVYLIKDIKVENIQEKVAAFIDLTLKRDCKFAKFHEKNKVKNYCFDHLAPRPEKEKLYQKDHIYSATIRTMDVELARYLFANLPNTVSDEMKGLVCDIKQIPHHFVETLYSLTSVILKTDEGYWRRCLRMEDFEYYLVENLKLKYEILTGGKIEKEVQLFDSITFLNEGPIPLKYKNVQLLGDKIKLHLCSSKEAQDLAQVAIASGIGGMNSRGAGFVNYNWMR